MISYGWVLIIAVVSALTGFRLGMRVNNVRPSVDLEPQTSVPHETEPLQAASPKPEPPKPAKPVQHIEDEFEKIAVAIAVAAFNSGK